MAKKLKRKSLVKTHLSLMISVLIGGLLLAVGLASALFLVASSNDLRQQAAETPIYYFCPNGLDRECPAGLVCVEDGKCGLNTAPTSVPCPNGTDWECPDQRYSCIDGDCKLLRPVINPNPTPRVELTNCKQKCPSQRDHSFCDCPDTCYQVMVSVGRSCGGTKPLITNIPAPTPMPTKIPLPNCDVICKAPKGWFCDCPKGCNLAGYTGSGETCGGKIDPPGFPGTGNF